MITTAKNRPFPTLTSSLTDVIARSPPLPQKTIEPTGHESPKKSRRRTAAGNVLLERDDRRSPSPMEKETAGDDVRALHEVSRVLALGVLGSYERSRSHASVTACGVAGGHATACDSHLPSLTRANTANSEDARAAGPDFGGCLDGFGWNLKILVIMEYCTGMLIKELKQCWRK